MTIAFQISDHTLTFYAKGRPWTIASDAPNFQQIREGLLTSMLDADALVELADVKVAIQNCSADGLLHFVGDILKYKDQQLTNVWVDKLLRFRAEELPFDPIFKALESLLQNPSFSARERLPIFVERSKLGFLPDGRIAAFKVIRSDWMDIRSGAFDNSIGKVVSMPREDVDDDPDHTCSHGLHVGALQYIPDYGLYDDDKRVILVAVKAEDFVAIPKDYDGSKARVSSYEVLEEVDKKFIKEFVDENQSIIRTHFGIEEEDDSPSVDDRVQDIVSEFVAFDTDGALKDMFSSNDYSSFLNRITEEFDLTPAATVVICRLSTVDELVAYLEAME